MSHVISMSEVNQFLPQEKLEVSVHDDVVELEDTARDIAFSRLAVMYDTTLWIDPTTTPGLVRSIIALFVAGWLYNRQFSEESSTEGSYGERRLEDAWRLLDMLSEGLLTIEDATPVATDQPSFLDTEPIFEMGEAF